LDYDEETRTHSVFLTSVLSDSHWTRRSSSRAAYLLAAVVHYLVNALEFVVHDGLGLPNPVWGDVWVIHHPVDDETGRQPPF